MQIQGIPVVAAAPVIDCSFDPVLVWWNLYDQSERREAIEPPADEEQMVFSLAP